MLDISTEGVADSQQLSTSIGLFQREKAAIADQRKEIGVLIKQAVSEIDRLTQLNRDLSPQMRQLEANIEGFPRAEIKKLYTTFQEAQMRLFMMQNQLEQLRSRQANLERMEQLLLGFLNLASSLHASEQIPRDGLMPEQIEGMAATPASRIAMLNSLETARQRLSRQLQDGPAQALSDLILRTEVCERLVAMDAHKGQEELCRLRSAVSSALKSTRQLIYELQPPSLEEAGLGAALRKYINSSRLRDTLQIDLEVAGQEIRLPEATETALFRTIQEALTNASEHSGTAKVDVALRFDTDHLVVTVSDEGRGFDVKGVLEQIDQRDHSGLADIRARATLAGGSLELESAPNAGCTVKLTIPL